MSWCLAAGFAVLCLSIAQQSAEVSIMHSVYVLRSEPCGFKRAYAIWLLSKQCQLETPLSCADNHSLKQLCGHKQSALPFLPDPAVLMSCQDQHLLQFSHNFKHSFQIWASPFGIKTAAMLGVGYYSAEAPLSFAYTSMCTHAPASRCTPSWCFAISPVSCDRPNFMAVRLMLMQVCT